MAGKHTCPKCGVPVPHTGLPGRWPIYCEEHRSKQAKKRAREAAQRFAQAQADTDRGDDFVAPSPSETSSIDPSWHPHLLAVGLSVTDDPERAAAIFGVPARGVPLDLLLIEARKLGDLTRRKPAAIGGILTAAISASAIKLAASVHTIPANQLPQAIRALAQATEMLCGSALPTTGQITISIKAAA